MTTVSERSKGLRGTKRVCQACEVRFYDLARDPIVCPVCGAEYTPAAAPVAPSAAPFTAKTGWRRGARREHPAPTVPNDLSGAPEVGEEVADEAAAAVSPDQDIVLEPEADDTDVSDLVDRDDKDSSGQ
jgi:uncharacterized protein (TIGR02300 family)